MAICIVIFSIGLVTGGIAMAAFDFFDFRRKWHKFIDDEKDGVLYVDSEEGLYLELKQAIENDQKAAIFTIARKKHGL